MYPTLYKTTLSVIMHRNSNLFTLKKVYFSLLRGIVVLSKFTLDQRITAMDSSILFRKLFFARASLFLDLHLTFLRFLFFLFQSFFTFKLFSTPWESTYACQKRFFLHLKFLFLALGKPYGNWMVYSNCIILLWSDVLRCTV